MARGRTTSMWWVGITIVGTAFMGMLIASWGRWADAFTDYGQQLYAAWQVLEGRLLYRDILWLYGPLSVYLQAAAFAIGGTSIQTLVVFNVLLVAGTTAVLFALFSALYDARTGTACGFVFVTCFAFAHLVVAGNYSFVVAYAQEVPHGVELAVVAIFLLHQYSRRGRRWLLVSVGVCLGLISLTKVEVFVAAAGGIGAGVLAVGRQRRLGTASWLWFVAGVGAPVVLAVLGLVAQGMALGDVWQAVAGHHLRIVRDDTSQLAMYRTGAGLDDVGGNLAQLLWVASMWAVWIAVPMLMAWWRTRVGVHVGMLLVFAATAVAVAFRSDMGAWFEIGRPLPLAVTVIGGVAAVECLTGRGRPERAAIVLAWSVFSLLLLGKILLHARLYHYGFALAMPGTLLVVATLVGEVPAWLDTRGRAGWVAAVGMLVVVLVASSRLVDLSNRNWRSMTQAIASGTDRYWTYPRFAGPIDAVLDDIARLVRPEQTLVVVPDGIVINYLTRRRSSLRYVSYIYETIVLGESKVLEAFRTRPPDFVLIVHRETPEHGHRTFGRDYGRSIWTHIGRHYRPVAIHGAIPFTSPDFGVLLLERK